MTGMQLASMTGMQLAEPGLDGSARAALSCCHASVLAITSSRVHISNPELEKYAEGTETSYVR